MAKGIASHILAIVLILAIFMFFALLIIYNWLDTTNQQANETLCTAKILNYCTDWFTNGFKNKPWDWNSKGPQGCDKYHVTEPVSANDCKALLGIK